MSPEFVKTDYSKASYVHVPGGYFHILIVLALAPLLWLLRDSSALFTTGLVVAFLYIAVTIFLIELEDKALNKIEAEARTENTFILKAYLEREYSLSLSEAELKTLMGQGTRSQLFHGVEKQYGTINSLTPEGICDITLWVADGKVILTQELHKILEDTAA